MQEQPVEDRGRAAVQDRQSGGVQGAPPAETRQLGEKRLARGHELRDRVGQADAGGRQPGRLVIDDGASVALESIARGRVPGIGVEEVDEGRDQAATVLAEGLALEVVIRRQQARTVDRLRRGGTGRVVPAVDAIQPLG